MKNWKRCCCAFLTAALLCTVFAGCGGKTESQPSHALSADLKGEREESITLTDQAGWDVTFFGPA